jgi:hypothetical protein
MGFLDHSTNNVIVDAVLTDAGRRALSRNDGSFQIFQFALGDDEVDYEIIEQFGRTVGKEKIEKNTPVMEALTVGSLGLKYKLVSVDNEFVTHFPNMSIRTGATIVTADNSSIPDLLIVPLGLKLIQFYSQLTEKHLTLFIQTILQFMNWASLLQVDLRRVQNLV